MFAGNLKETIVIESSNTHKNELGEVVDCGYREKLRTKAQVIYQSGTRTIDNNEIFHAYSIQFVVRFYHEISESDRVVYRGQRYRIDSIEHSREYQLIKLNCDLIND